MSRVADPLGSSSHGDGKGAIPIGTTSSGGRPRKYDAFISYSRAADGKLAPAVQRALQRFAKPWYKTRALRVFRDDASLSANPDLWDSICDALDDSEYYILLASPEAAGSEWVEKEATYWLEHRGNERLLIVLTDGELVWDKNGIDWSRTTALPPALASALPSAPRYIDVSWARSEQQVADRDPRFRNAIADLAAPLHGRAKDDLLGDDVQQHKRALRLAWSAAALLALLAVGASIAAVLAVHARDRAQRAQSEALAGQALATVDSEPRAALALAVRSASVPTQEAETALRVALASNLLRATLRGHKGKIWDAAFSPDGRRVVTGGADGTARLWDSTSGRLVRTFASRDGAVGDVAFSAGGSRVVTVSDAVQVWDAATGRLLHKLAGTKSAQSVAISSDGKLILTVGFSAVELWDSASGRKLHTFVDPTTEVAVFSPDDRRVLTDGGTTPRIWDSASGRLRAKLRRKIVLVSVAAFSPDGRRVLTAGEDGGAWVWDSGSGRLLHRLRSAATVQSAAFSPDGTRILTASDDGTARVWDAATGRSLRTVDTRSTLDSTAAFSPDGRLFLTASDDGAVRLWEAADGKNLATLAGGSVDYRSVSFSPDGSLILSLGVDGVARVWDNPERGPLRTLHDRGARSIEDAVFGPDRRLALVSSEDGAVQVRALADGHVVRSFPGSTGDRRSAAFSPDARFVLVGDIGSARIFETDSGRAVRSLRGPPGGGVSSVAFSTDGKRVVTTSFDGRARIWEVANGRLLHKFGGRTLIGADGSAVYKGVWNAAFSPDGKFVVTASDDGTARLWSSGSGQLVRTIRGHNGAAVNSAVFSPDGKLVLTAGEDGTARLWDVATGAAIRSFGADSGAVYDAGFSPDGKVIVAATGDGTARLWDSASGRLLRTFRNPGDAVFSPDGKLVLMAGAHGTLTFWSCDVCGVPLKGLLERARERLAAQ